MPRHADSSVRARLALFSLPVAHFISFLRPLRLCDLCVNSFAFLFLALAVFFVSGCSHNRQSGDSSVVFLIESNPTNLDPRFATDSQSQRIDGLLFGSLLERENQMNFHGDLAESWSTPDPLTYVFHLRRGVRFHDGRPLNASDVKGTFDFIMNPANKSPKRGAFRPVTSIEAPDDATVIFRLSEPYASFPGNLIRPTMGIVPANAGADFSRHPIGSGPFRFVQQAQDEEVVVERNSDYFRGAPPCARALPRRPGRRRSRSGTPQGLR
jgi:peptide/nickel transport system substrate-binding protein